MEQSEFVFPKNTLESRIDQFEKFLDVLPTESVAEFLPRQEHGTYFSGFESGGVISTILELKPATGLLFGGEGLKTAVPIILERFPFLRTCGSCKFDTHGKQIIVEEGILYNPNLVRLKLATIRPILDKLGYDYLLQGNIENSLNRFFCDPKRDVFVEGVIFGYPMIDCICYALQRHDLSIKRKRIYSKWVKHNYPDIEKPLPKRSVDVSFEIMPGMGYGWSHFVDDKEYLEQCEAWKTIGQSNIREVIKKKINHRL